LSICISDIQGHNRLSCKSCHSAWSPHCLGCHTKYNPTTNVFDHIDQKEKTEGWIEFASDFYAEIPTLGVRLDKGKEIIDTFIPGMILTIFPKNEKKIFRRLYAPVSPHTTSLTARDCKYCHNNSLALGFGRGQLNFDSDSNNWVFTPKYAINPIDNLPEDAWTGFLETRNGMVSTRVGARPFNKTEQQKILRIGACLTCHEPSAKNLEKIYFDFNKALSKITENCFPQ